ncbi:hypothetical protein F4780DRAFT_479725 [Xylariomycetidae sp. FL0641]|nr:hypothetical protein F4780DRAFT_479725 [Xylariomycetidae sp. FL0641]
MGFSSRWRFGSNRKQSTASSAASNSSNGTTTPENETSELTKTPSRLMRSLTGGLKERKAKKKLATPEEYAHLHKPFTRQNLEHQKMLNAFEWNFGRTISHGGRSELSGVSPGASRHTSFEVDRSLPPSNLGETRVRFAGTLPSRPPDCSSCEDDDKDPSGLSDQDIPQIVEIESA